MVKLLQVPEILEILCPELPEYAGRRASSPTYFLIVICLIIAYVINKSLIIT